ncbi:E3 ubiquitin-protein ligase huwe1 [Desmophyllum pertusum]|uniref:E3 ubiquitin-protein ligase huwe1 n=1 Tax=Desmophyllum pertusum TaxID=174260 RepID=A0A9W9YJ43_9CNID|nr:E3 ubiquitin-protein ligase huwe1 [Desmophyllum pertusum]
MMSTATPASAVVQDIISAATVEAASLSAGDEVEAPAADSFQGSVGEAERTEQDAAQQESDGSPMALEEDGTAATPSAGLPEPSTAATAAATPDGGTAAGPASDADQPGTSGEASALTIDGIPIPDGVDPSFLEALPEAIRREVLAEHLGLHQPPPSQRNAASNENEGSADMNVSPEFLAALPPGCSRRVLADIDDSLLPLLPTDLASEAQTLRREIEARHHRLLQERFNFGSGDRASAISALLRHSALSRHGGGSHFARLLPSGGGLSGRVTGFSNGPPYLPPPNRKIIGRHLLDHDALTCLLVLLFVEEPRLNTGRLHKVLRNLCYHEETRSWLINAMIAILRRTSGQPSDGSCPVPCVESSSHAEASSSNHETDRTESPCRLDEYLHTQEHSSSDSKALKQHSWLSFGVRTSLGSRTNVFCIKRQGKAGLERSTNVSIHPQASHFVCKHVLDALLFLAKSFPASFTPFLAAQPHPSCSNEDSSSTEGKPLLPPLLKRAQTSGISCLN